MSDSVPAPQVWPTLQARDARALITFLEEAFGFKPTIVYGETERVEHAEIEWPAGGGIMMASSKEESKEPWQLQPGTFGAYAVTDDPDGLFARSVRAGAQVLIEPHDTEYGSREFAVKDPEGNLWSFGTYRGQRRAL
jgi:uncharacterized glyoxalase superfamily protein PhnB